MMTDNRALQLARKTAARYADVPPVTAVALGGSLAAGSDDAGSDIDLYVYASVDISLADRRRIAEEDADRADVDNRFWEPGDEWIDRDTRIKVDVTFRSPAWIEEQLDRVLVYHQASTGYSTCFWDNVLNAQLLYDREGWFERLQERARQPYPEPLRRAIVAKNYPILRERLSAYTHQLESAVRREDMVSINHRVAALLASYFDVLFAINRLPHPGEKRLLRAAETRCDRLPAAMRQDVDYLLRAACEGQEVIPAAEALVSGLDELLVIEGFLRQGTGYVI